jgi:RNA polymerase sigma factor (sigma-70 family)
VATTSAPHESLHPHGRPDDGAAAARTGELFTAYQRTVVGICRALLRDASEAEDAAQQTFLSAHRALLNGVEPREPAAWLATIARNECWARIKTRMREPLPAHELEIASTQADPLAEAIRRADLAALWRAIEALPRQQRDALLLREFGGLTYDELAAALAVSAPAVESLLFRARSRLRTQLRAAYASVSGASWLETLARIFAGGGAPVAAKVAALGVGAAAVTGGAVVAPTLLDRHTRAPAPAHRTPAHARHAPTAEPIAPVFSVRTPAPAASHPAAPPPAHAQTVSRPVEAASDERREGRVAEPEHRGTSEEHQTTVAAAEQEGRDGGGSSGSSSSGSGSSEGSGSSGGDSSSGGEDSHGGTTTVEAPALDGGATVPLPTTVDGGGDGGGDSGSGGDGESVVP